MKRINASIGSQPRSGFGEEEAEESAKRLREEQAAAFAEDMQAIAAAAAAAAADVGRHGNVQHDNIHDADMEEGNVIHRIEDDDDGDNENTNNGEGEQGKQGSSIDAVAAAAAAAAASLGIGSAPIESDDDDDTDKDETVMDDNSPRGHWLSSVVHRPPRIGESYQVTVLPTPQPQSQLRQHTATTNSSPPATTEAAVTAMESSLDNGHGVPQIEFDKK